jgi:hypothetical protein
MPMRWRIDEIEAANSWLGIGITAILPA